MPLVTMLMLLWTASGLQAQQDYHFTQFQFNKLALNPAYAGSREVLSFTGLYRHQWAGFDGAPRTFTFSAHSPIGNERLAMGMLIYSDRLGVTNQTGLVMSAAYRLPLGESDGAGKLSAGIQAGFIGYRNELTQLNPQDPDDILLQNDLRLLLPNVGLGAFWSNERSFAGFSVPHVLKSDLTQLGDFDDEKTGVLYPHIYLMGGHVFDINPMLRLRPSALLKMVAGQEIAAPVDLDLNLSALLLDRVWLGAGYRVGDSFDLMAEYRVTDQLMIGYSYDFTTSQLAAYEGGSHEVLIRYELAFPEKGWVTPRYIHYF